MFPDNLTAVSEVPPGKYAMWFSTPEESSFAASETRKHITRAFAAVNGYESYVFADLLIKFEVLDDRYGGVELFDEGITLYFKEAEDDFLIFTATRDKGMRIHFPVETAAFSSLVSHWRHFADYTEWWRRVIDAGGCETDDAENPRTLEWWLSCEQISLDIENSEDQSLTMIGAIFH